MQALARYAVASSEFLSFAPPNSGWPLPIGAPEHSSPFEFEQMMWSAHWPKNFNLFYRKAFPFMRLENVTIFIIFYLFHCTSMQAIFIRIKKAIQVRSAPRSKSDTKFLTNKKRMKHFSTKVQKIKGFFITANLSSLL